MIHIALHYIPWHCIIASLHYIAFHTYCDYCRSESSRIIQIPLEALQLLQSRMIFHLQLWFLPVATLDYCAIRQGTHAAGHCRKWPGPGHAIGDCETMGLSWSMWQKRKKSWCHLKLCQILFKIIQACAGKRVTGSKESMREFIERTNANDLLDTSVSVEVCISIFHWRKLGRHETINSALSKGNWSAFIFSRIISSAWPWRFHLHKGSWSRLVEVGTWDTSFQPNPRMRRGQVVYLPCVFLLDAKQHKNSKNTRKPQTTPQQKPQEHIGTLRRRERRRRRREEGGDEGGGEEEAAAINGDTMETYGNILDIHQISPKYSLYLFVHVTKAYKSLKHSGNSP